MANLLIGNNLVGWTGANLALASAPWKDNVGGGIFKVSANRQGLISFKPTSSFPAVTALETGAFYLFRVTTAFDLAGAVLELPPTSPAPAPDTYSFSAPDGGGLTTEFAPALLSAKAVLSAPSFSVGAGTLEVRVDGGSYTTLSAANAAIAAVAPGAAYRLQVRMVRTSSAAATATLTATY